MWLMWIGRMVPHTRLYASNADVPEGETEVTFCKIKVATDMKALGNELHQKARSPPFVLQDVPNIASLCVCVRIPFMQQQKIEHNSCPAHNNDYWEAD